MKKSVLITGGAKRIGRKIAKFFAMNDWHVIIHYNRSKFEAETLFDELNSLGKSVEIIGFDLENLDQIESQIEKICAQHKNLAAIINNASIFEYDNALSIEMCVFNRAININCLAPIKIMQAFAKFGNFNQDRRIINIIDQKLENPNPDFFSYTISKAGLLQAAKMLALEYLPSRIRIFNIAPGISLPSGDQTHEDFKAAAKLNLLAIENDANSIAEAAFFLCTRKLKTNQTFFIDSGQHLLKQSRDVMFIARGEN